MAELEDFLGLALDERLARAVERVDDALQSRRLSPFAVPDLVGSIHGAPPDAESLDLKADR
ncbi:hypothetical protein JQ506_25070 (plasmid) [Shinella sp. PSBB067]|uniref:hypothetical protein n=1 Tax=Shinella sp. PSBB067 TaxID=2715959 RepID=UPI00193AF221|nr:hypothetical protein JQ506_25070 [Shinella sp. PSBB067]